MIQGAIRTITSDNNKLVIVGNVVDSDFWKGGDDLLLGWEIRALLELEIANGARQGKVAIDSSEVDKSTSCADSCLFAFGVSVLWTFCTDVSTHPRSVACGRKIMALHGP